MEGDAVYFASEDGADDGVAHFVDDGCGLSDSGPDGGDADDGYDGDGDDEDGPGFRGGCDVPAFEEYVPRGKDVFPPLPKLSQPLPLSIVLSSNVCAMGHSISMDGFSFH